MKTEKSSLTAEDTLEIKNKTLNNLDNNDKNMERNAQYKRNKEEKYAKNGFINTKIYLGRDVYERLAEIYEDLLGEKLNYTGRKNTDDLSRVISYCIVKLYKEMYIKKDKGSLDDIEPAKTKKAQHMYDLYQSALYRSFSGKNDFSLVSQLNNDGVIAPGTLHNTHYQRKNIRWDREELANLMDLNELNETIKVLNEG
ncbi:hypothetical protein QD58_22910 [Salmonella enterica]|nr:hypothetical protein [Salmonella enterica]EAW9415082.1 hypothetical protein [Salmonella enterica]EEL9726023.1 hypothetical protein [Salmonella enterica subsp. enterica serovar Infantis]EHR9462086.1 hypothetical protein [Salmonella enterica subsp. enterica]